MGNAQNLNTGKDMMAESKFYMGYSRWKESDRNYETWNESVGRVMQMHKEKYKDKLSTDLLELMQVVENAYVEKRMLGAQRALQFGGEQLLKHEMRSYNCVSHYCDRPKFFQETMYLLLCGAGVGFSVQKHHVEKLPKVHKRYEKKSKVFTVPDDIEGWADSFGVLLSSYFTEDSPFPEYQGCQVHFDFSKIRPKGAMISGGFKAPGPDSLRASLVKCEEVIEQRLKSAEKQGINLRPIDCYDFVMHMADAVLSGGVRRSATICMFSKDDKEMLTAKTGDWFTTHPARARSNNSVMLKRDTLTREEWKDIMHSVKSFGEPGFIFTDNLDFTFNPLTRLAA